MQKDAELHQTIAASSWRQLRQKGWPPLSPHRACDTAPIESHPRWYLRAPDDKFKSSEIYMNKWYLRCFASKPGLNLLPNALRHLQETPLNYLHPRAPAKIHSGSPCTPVATMAEHCFVDVILRQYDSEYHKNLNILPGAAGLKLLIPYGIILA